MVAAWCIAPGVDVEACTVGLSARRLQVLTIVATAEASGVPATAADVMERVAATHATVYNTLNALRREGLITRVATSARSQARPESRRSWPDPGMARNAPRR